MASKSALVLLSGGSDSVTLLAWAVQGYSCRALYLNTVEQENRELHSAKAAAEAAKVKLDVIDFSKPMAALRGGDAPIPFACTLAISMAVSYATRLGIDNVLLGVTADDINAQIPEHTCNYIEKFEETVKICRKSIQILTPFIQKSKHEVCELGKKLGVDYSKTWSCDNLKVNEHCGKCNSCTDRRKAFKLSGITDETLYMQEDDIPGEIPGEVFCGICVIQ